MATPFDMVVIDEIFCDEPSSMRGSDATRQLREHEVAAGLPPAIVVACTGNASYMEAALLEHADLVWGKPFPDFSDGTMQRSLTPLLARRTAAQQQDASERI